MNRWYSSQIGRFTTPDPYRASASLANPQNWNRYSYVENDPVNKNDPSGLDPITQVLTPGSSYCPPSMGSCVWIPTPGGFSPYGVVGSGIGAVDTGSALGTMSTDMAAGEVRHVVQTVIPGYIRGLIKPTPSGNATVVTSSLDFNDGSGEQYTTSTFTLYDADGNIVHSVTPDFDDILLGSVPSLRTATPAIFALYQAMAANGQRYFGITSDLARRTIEHARNGIAVNQAAILHGVDYLTAKGAEQFMINAYGLTNLSNRINSIADTNPLYREALQKGCQALSSAGQPVPCP